MWGLDVGSMQWCADGRVVKLMLAQKPSLVARLEPIMRRCQQLATCWQPGQAATSHLPYGNQCRLYALRAALLCPCRTRKSPILGLTCVTGSRLGP